METKTKKETIHTPLKVTKLLGNTLTEKDFQKFFEIESIMLNEDRFIFETYHWKNELEARIYDYREKLSTIWTIYTTKSEPLNTLLDTKENWLYDKGRNSKKSTYQSYLKEVEDSFKDIIERYRVYQTIPMRLQQFNLVLISYEEFCVSKVKTSSKI